MFFVSKSIYLSSSAFPSSTFLWGIDHHHDYVGYQLRPAATTTTWTVAKNASASYAELTASVASTGFGTPVKPLGTTLPNSSGWVSGPYNGVFRQAQGTMSIQVAFNGSVISAQVGRLMWRLWRANTQTGTGASLITPLTLATAAITVPATITTVTGSFLLTSSLSMQNEFLILETAWSVTTAGGSNTADVRFMAGSASFLRTGPYEATSYIPLIFDNAGPGI